MGMLEQQEKACQRAWEKACEWEGIDPKSTSAVFSEDNPHVALYNALMLGYQAMLKEKYEVS